ncbi:MAG TPA: hypothetical protein VMD98_12950 [Bryocella sp.]|nr:hypothetical protein [Bryocella sp.]
MSDRGLAVDISYSPATRWGAIWAGVFTFAAIWTVFESLAIAVFPNTSGGSIGFQIWTVILTIIAMYVAGLETGRLAAIANRHDGLIHGMVMFGLSAVSAVILMTFATGMFWRGNTAHVVTISAGTEWGYFCALFLGWLAAMAGASTGVARRVIGSTASREPIPMRPAA